MARLSLRNLIYTAEFENCRPRNSFCIRKKNKTHRIKGRHDNSQGNSGPSEKGYA